MSLFASCCCDKTLTKSNLGRNGFIWITAHSPSSRETKAGIEAETMDAAYWLIQLLFLYSPGPLAQGWHCPQVPTVN